MDYVTVSCCYYQNANGANFDRIKVNIDECGTSYTYDDDGNLISAKDNAGRIAVLMFVAIIACMIRKTNKSMTAEYALSK